MEARAVGSSVLRLGFWSAMLTAIWTIMFIVAFGAYMSSLPTEWTGIDSFVSTFDSNLYLAWVIPCLLLALTFPVLMSCIHFYSSDDKKIWSWLGLIYAIMYGAVLSTNYWLLATVVRESILKGYTEGLAWFVIGSPHSITNTIEGIGYGFMGLAALFVGPVFEGGRLERIIKWLFIINGIAGIAGVAFGGASIMAATWVSLAVWVITFPLATILVAILFKRGIASYKPY